MQVENNDRFMLKTKEFLLIMVTNTLSVRFSTIRKNTIILKSIFMKTRKMYNSSANLKKMSITLALSSAMLCPVAANAAGNGNVAPSPQAVQQSGVVKGNIVDETGLPMIGVTVIPMGQTKNGTVTDLDGNFTLNNVSGKVTLEISYVGYKTQKVQATVGTPLSLKMVPESNQPDDVVVDRKSVV